MKKLLLVTVALFIITCLKAQHPEKIIHFLKTNFENNNPYPYYPGWLTDTINPWVIDESNPENVWQIGKPHKAIFDTAYSVPNAIITDTLNPYPPNNHSSFQFLITKPEWAQNRCMSLLYLYFHHKIETDTLQDGGFIDVSYDNGITWDNVLNQNDASDKSYQNFYSENDTIKGGEFAFSGEYIKTWEYSGVEWYWDDEEASEIDSITIRFNFKSDDLDNNKAGWMIDNIYLLIEDYCTIGIDGIKKEHENFIYPNPVRDVSLLELPDNDTYKIQIFNIQGLKVFGCKANKSIEIYKDDFQPGIYIYYLTSPEGKTYSGKFIIN